AELVQSGKASNTGELRCQILQSLVVSKVLVAKAEIDSIIVDEVELKESFDRRWESIAQNRTDAELKEILKIDNLEMFKSELRSQLKEQLTVDKMKSHIEASVKINPSEVRRFFNRIPKDSLPVFPSEMEVSQIVKMPPLLKEEKDKVRNRLEQIRKKIIEEGQSFEEMAKIYSEDGSKDAGGDLGWSKRGNMVPEFEAVVFKLKPGEISQPVESPFGYHLIKLLDRRGDEFHAEHILLMPDWEQVDLTASERFLDSLANRIRQDSISFEKAAILYSDDKGANSTNTAHNGGRIRNESGTYQISIREMDSFLMDMLDNMQVGEISKTHSYRTFNNRKAVRIIQYKAKHPAHVANFNTDYTKVQQVALQNKQNQALLEWLKKAKNEVYIKIDEEYAPCNILSTE
ncbi:MAG: peptidylprolyl isomerase, partial [Thermonemataceae bacterium]|nr:peptidylprolyl isomerase [Thermonemataceae bacterium]